MRRAEGGNYGESGPDRKGEERGQEERQSKREEKMLPAQKSCRAQAKKGRGFQRITRLKELSPFSIGFEPIIPK
jgi:hypothetical protein